MVLQTELVKDKCYSDVNHVTIKTFLENSRHLLSTIVNSISKSKPN